MIFGESRKKNEIKKQSALMYEAMCPRCQMLMHSNPQAKLNEYCEACQAAMKPFCEKIARLLK